ncbi:MAG TPA: hypothetical protein VFB90_01355, partial [Dehalococcoidia bacterium]|nr:hypothetical protein [Dehalococcoidia bacterium]
IQYQAGSKGYLEANKLPTDKALLHDLIGRLKVSPQALYQRADRLKKKHGPMTTEDAIYMIAANEGLDLAKYLDKVEVERLRMMRLSIGQFVAGAPIGTNRQQHVAISPPNPVAQTVTPSRSSLFNSRSFHPLVEKSSRKLFIDRHDTEAVRKAFQGLIN